MKRGFTIIEVILALTISTLMLLVVIAGSAARISRQRYNDSVTDFAEFIRRVYSEVINVQNVRSGSIGTQNDYCTLAGQYAAAMNASSNGANVSSDGFPGRSGCAIYGKLITLGENNESDLYVYDIIGDAVDINNQIGVANTDQELSAVFADVTALIPTYSNCTLSTASETYKYSPQWAATIENPDGDLYQGAILIARAPTSGAVHTYVMQDDDVAFQKLISRYHSSGCGDNAVKTIGNDAKNTDSTLTELLKTGKFSNAEADFCVNSDDIFSLTRTRSNVRLHSDGSNGTAVEVVETDLPADEGGNKCR